MKKLKMSNFKINKKGTKAIREKAAVAKEMKITINFDTEATEK